MNLENKFYQGRFDEVTDNFYQACIKIEEESYEKAKFIIQNNDQDQVDDGYRYLNLILEVYSDGLNQERLEKFREFSAINTKYQLAYSSVLYSAGEYDKSLSTAHAINKSLLSDAQYVLYLQLLCLLKIEKDSNVDIQFEEFKSKAYDLIEKNEFWLLKPYLLFLEIKKELVFGDIEKAKIIAEFSKKTFNHKKFKKSMAPIHRFLDDLKRNEYEKINLTNKPQLQEVFNKMRSSEYMTKEQIFNLLYDESYNPLHHDSRIYMIIRRLKGSIVNSNLSIVKSVNGWRLQEKSINQ